MLTQTRLHHLLHYDPESGLFTWKNPQATNVKVGQVAGSVKSNGYLQCQIDGKRYLVHRLAWLYMTGEWPENDIDHINRIKSDNRWENLRKVTRTINAQNLRKATSTSISGLLGAHKERDRWSAKIRVNGRRVYLGRFDTPEEAHAAYVRAKRELHDGCTI